MVGELGEDGDLAFLRLDVVNGAEIDARSEIEGALEESSAVVEVVVNGEVLRDEGQLWLGDLASVVVLERQLHLCKVVEEFAGQLVEEHGALTVELRSQTDPRPLWKRPQ